MFRKMLIVGFVLILAVSGNLYSQIAPDSILGDFTKCTTYTWDKYDKNTNEKYLSSIAVYNSSGKVLSEQQKKSNGTNAISTKCNYDDNGVRFETQYFNQDGKLAFRSPEVMRNKTEMPKSGSQTDKPSFSGSLEITDNEGKNIEISENNTLTTKSENDPRISNKYDEKNRQIEVVYYNPDHTAKLRITYEYDAFGNISKEMTYSSDNKPMKIIEFGYSK